MTVRAAEPSDLFLVPGSIEVETALMGTWVFMRTTYSPMSGYTSGWCDVPHWGLVLTGDLALNWEGGVELLTAGDVYYCPAGPPGHQFQAGRRDDDRLHAARTVRHGRPRDGVAPCRAPARRGKRGDSVRTPTTGAGGDRVRAGPQEQLDDGTRGRSRRRSRVRRDRAPPRPVPGRLTVSRLVTAPAGAGRLGVRWVRGARSRRGRRSSA